MHIYADTILHIDMYRIDSEELLHTRGILDAIDSHTYIVIEWPKYTDLYRDDSWIHIMITHGE